MRLATAQRYAARRPTHDATCLYCGNPVSNHDALAWDYCVRLLRQTRAIAWAKARAN